VNSLPIGHIEMEVQEQTQTLNLKCARFEANIKGLDASEFPAVPTAEVIEGRNSLHLEPDAFRTMIDRTVFAAATDESRPILTGVLAKFHQGGLILAAADGFRLAVTSATVGTDLDDTASIIVPARALSELGRISA
jgi:DNA polymerase-3 subunit beta